jgi:hypothetical protein
VLRDVNTRRGGVDELCKVTARQQWRQDGDRGEEPQLPDSCKAARAKPIPIAILAA